MIKTKHVALVGGIAAYLIGLLWFSRHHMLDDALIHLRYAEFYLEKGFFTVDGETPSFGASSPLFVYIVAFVHSFVRSDLTAKAVSVVFYILLLLVLILLTVRSRDDASRRLWLALLVVVMTPMAIRWLSAGMETSLVVLLCIAVGHVAASADVKQRPIGILLAFTCGLVSILTRVDMALPLALMAAAIAVGRLCDAGSCPRRDSLRKAILAILPLALGTLGGLALTYLQFGTIVPDSAIAKSQGLFMPLDALWSLAGAFAGAAAFGMGLLALWGVSLWIAIAPEWRAGRTLWPTVIVNMALPCLWAIIAVRGQILHGIRHVVFVLAFMISANAVMRARSSVRPKRQGELATGSRVNSWLTLEVAVLGAVFASEAVLVYPIVRERSTAFLEMRRLNLSRLANYDGLAWDIGFLLYFSKGRICDAKGLINGRAMARLTTSERVERCMRRDIRFVLATPSQIAGSIASSERARPMLEWPTCATFLFRNLGPTEPHFLALAPDLAPAMCGDAAGRRLGAFAGASAR